jgi:hypothetical protein
MEYEPQQPDVRVSYGEFECVARVKKFGEAALGWHIAIYGGRRTISEWDGPEIEGDGFFVPSRDDIRRAEDEMIDAIWQYTIDPMSQG